LTPRESIQLAEAILEKYSTEYMLLKGSVRKCEPEIRDTIRAPTMDCEDA